MKFNKLQLVLTCLGLLAAIFHIWYAGRMPVITPTSVYFLASGALFLVGSVLVLVKGKGFLFSIGAWGLLALSAIDNGLLYYTRTYGFGILFPLMRGSRPAGNFSRPSFNGTLPTPPLNGTGGFKPPPGGFRGGEFGWFSSWNPPGPVQFFVLQSVIIAVVLLAIVVQWRTRPPENN